MLPIVLDEEIVDQLMKTTMENEGYELTADLERQVVITPTGKEYPFEVEAFRKLCLLNGLDDIGLTLQQSDAIKAYEHKMMQKRHGYLIKYEHKLND